MIVHNKPTVGKLEKNFLMKFLKNYFSQNSKLKNLKKNFPNT